MRKTDKKIDNQLRLVLTNVCETALKDISGFQWLTHLVNYTNFPASLIIVCVFDTNQNLAKFLAHASKSQLTSLIQVELLRVNVKLKNITEHVVYDTHENCDQEHDGNWALRLG